MTPDLHGSIRTSISQWSNLKSNNSMRSRRNRDPMGGFYSFTGWSQMERVIYHTRPKQRENWHEGDPLLRTQPQAPESKFEHDPSSLPQTCSCAHRSSPFTRKPLGSRVNKIPTDGGGIKNKKSRSCSRHLRVPFCIYPEPDPCARGGKGFLEKPTSFSCPQLCSSDILEVSRKVATRQI